MGRNALAREAGRPLGSRAFVAGRRRKTMTQATLRKVETLVRMTRKHADKVRRIRGAKSSPFALSAAKYYPALKKLAEK